jgi:D,D-heptose 1,7-bisphosphate phosphatase
MNKFIFLDRDGTINIDDGFIHDIHNLKFLPNAIKGLQLLNKAHFKFMIITNQSGIGRGYFTVDQFHAFNNNLISELEIHGIYIEKTYFCPHHPEVRCECRKPNPKSIVEASIDYGIDLNNSYMIGDHPSDIILGINAGIKTIYISNRDPKIPNMIGLNPDFVANDLLMAANWIIEEENE